MDDLRLFTIFEALSQGVSVDHIHDITKIDKWFICKLQNLVAFEASLQGGLTEQIYLQAKKYGYPDKTLARLAGVDPAALPHRSPSYKMVDTCAAEFQAQTPYFNATYDEHCDARNFPRTGRDTVIVLGSGPIRIGQGIEFDYSSVHCVQTLKELGYDVVIINNNPETVSTDYDTADRLYFEPLTPEDVMGVIEVEHPVGVVVAFGGQTAIALTEFLDQQGIPILGTSADGIDMAEDRGRFDALLEDLGIRRPKGMSVTTLEEALDASEALGFPVLLRPSYVIGGQNMVIARGRDVWRIYGRHHLSASKRRSGGQVHAWHRAGGGCDLRRHRRADARHHGAYRAGRRPQRRLHRRLSPVQPHRQDDACGGGVLGKAGPGSGHQGAGEHQCHSTRESSLSLRSIPGLPGRSPT